MNTPTTTRPSDGSHQGDVPQPRRPSPGRLGCVTDPAVAQGDNVTPPASAARPVRSWPVLLLALPAFVAIWSGWVGLGRLTGFGPVELLPGIWDGARINSAITLPIGMETYAAFALHVMLSHRVGARARTFARWSAIGSLVLGAAGQVAYHLMSAAGLRHAPWLITALVACLPVAVLGMGAALAHLVREDTGGPVPSSPTPDRLTDAPPSGSSRAPDPAPTAAAPTVPAAGRKSAPRKASAPRTAPTGATGTGTAARVARLKAEHPDMTNAAIAKRLRVSVRTVSRHLNPPATDPTGTTPTTTARTDPSTTAQTGDDVSRAA